MAQNHSNNNVTHSTETTQKGQNTNTLTINQATLAMRKFVAEREWEQFHTPRNLMMALVGEVGEVAEIFQWKGEVSLGVPQLSEKQKVHLGQELADVFSYLIRLSDVCKVDLSQAFQKKMIKNAQKYPKDLVKGSSKKYTEYRQLITEKEDEKGEK